MKKDMKKVLIAILAVVSLASCSNEETIVVAQPDVIGFGTPFVENATRAIDPSYGANGVELEKFNVWGVVKGNTGSAINIFNNDSVTGTIGDAAWSCTNKQYWVPLAEYDFVAITAADKVTVAPTAGLPTSITYNARTNPDADVMVAVARAETDAQSVPTVGVNAAGIVPFTFQHLLSKIKFTFTTSSAGLFKVSDIAIEGFYAEGTYPIGAGNNATWKLKLDGDGNTPAKLGAVSFGNASNTTKVESAAAEDITSTNSVTSNYEHLFLPGEYTAGSLKVTFTKDYYLKASDTTPASSETVNATLPALIALPNNAYNVVVNLEGGSQITFHIDTDENGFENWGSSTDVNPEEQQ